MSILFALSAVVGPLLFAGLLATFLIGTTKNGRFRRNFLRIAPWFYASLAACYLVDLFGSIQDGDAYRSFLHGGMALLMSGVAWLMVRQRDTPLPEA